MKKELFVFAACGLLCSGCKILMPFFGESSPSDEGTISSENDIIIAPQFESEVISNEDFEFSFNPDFGKCAFKALRDNVTLVELANFARHDCWDRRIKKKIEGEEVLTNNDLKLIEFCWKTQMMTVDTLAFAMLNDLTENDEILNVYKKLRDNEVWINLDTKDKPKIDPFEDDTEKVYCDLKVKFLTSNNSPIRKVIKKWGTQFRSANVPAAAWIEMYKNVYKNRSTMEQDNLEEDYRQWLWMPLIITKSESESFGKDELRKYASLLDESSDVTGERWQTMQEMTNKYLTDLNDIHRLLDAYTKNKTGKTDAKSIDAVQTIYEKHAEDTLAYNRYYKRALYDMPLVTYSHRAFAEIQSAKGFWNDDEDLMMDAARRYHVSIRGIDMVQNSHSMYSISAYSTIIEKLKNELDPEEFKTLCTQTKLYKVDIADDPMRENTCKRIEE